MSSACQGQGSRSYEEVEQDFEDSENMLNGTAMVDIHNYTFV